MTVGMRWVCGTSTGAVTTVLADIEAVLAVCGVVDYNKLYPQSAVATWRDHCFLHPTTQGSLPVLSSCCSILLTQSTRQQYHLGVRTNSAPHLILQLCTTAVIHNCRESSHNSLRPCPATNPVLSVQFSPNHGNIRSLDAARHGFQPRESRASCEKSR